MQSKIKKFVAVDSGKYATKACLFSMNDEKIKDKIVFRTKMDETDEESTYSKNSYVLEFNGEKYLIGDEAETVNFETSKAKDIHKLSTYAAIGQLIDDGEVIGLAIGCPLSTYNNKNERTQYKNFMFESGKISITINGIKKTFTIDKVFVFAESSGYLYKNAMKYKDSTVGVIDIGGLNTNNCVYQNLIPIKSTSFPTNLGCNVLRNELKQELNSTFSDINLQDWQMEEILRNGYIKSKKEESSEIINIFLQKHVNKILNECVKKGWDLKNMDLIFVGGGSKLLKDQIKKVIPDATISDTAEWDNVEGFAEFGAIKYEQ